MVMIIMIIVMYDCDKEGDQRGISRNIHELACCRLDAQKFVCETRRAVAERAENIGIWFKILEMLAKLAVISNVSKLL